MDLCSLATKSANGIGIDYSIYLVGQSHTITMHSRKIVCLKQLLQWRKKWLKVAKPPLRAIQWFVTMELEGNWGRPKLLSHLLNTGSINTEKQTLVEYDV
jgi:hypothetical protein